MTTGKVTQITEQGGLISYLAKLGLGDADLTKVVSLMRETKDESPAQFIEAPPAKPEEDLFDALPLEELGFSEPMGRKPAVFAPQKSVKVFLSEEQQILKEAYLSFFTDEASIEILGSSDDTSIEGLADSARSFKPDVMLLGVKTVQRNTIEKLEKLREACPGVGLVLLFAFYDAQGLKALREFSKDSSAGCAYLLKHTVDTVDELTQVIFSVMEGRIIIDPMVMEGLIKTGDANSSFLRELSPRELEVLSWMAKGYRNDTISGVLSRDVKTVERHINNIYSKLHSDREAGADESRHPRVQAALTYLKATGLLPADQFIDD